MRAPLDPNQRIDFSLEDDVDNPTVFKLKPLTGSEKMRCMTTFGVAKIDETIRFGLVGWENYGDAVFDETNMQANIDRLDTAEFSAVGVEILKISGLDPELKKKSSSASRSSKPDENLSAAESESANAK